MLTIIRFHQEVAIIILGMETGVKDNPGLEKSRPCFLTVLCYNNIEL